MSSSGLLGWSGLLSWSGMLGMGLHNSCKSLWCPVTPFRDWRCAAECMLCIRGSRCHYSSLDHISGIVGIVQLRSWLLLWSACAPVWLGKKCFQCGLCWQVAAELTTSQSWFLSFLLCILETALTTSPTTIRLGMISSVERTWGKPRCTASTFCLLVSWTCGIRGYLRQALGWLPNDRLFVSEFGCHRIW